MLALLTKYGYIAASVLIFINLIFTLLLLNNYLDHNSLDNKQIKRNSTLKKAVAFYVNINSSDYKSDFYLTNTIVLLNQIKKYHKGPSVDYLFLYCNNGPLSERPMELPKKLELGLKELNVKPILVPETEGTPIWWFYNMSINGHHGYKRAIGKIHLWTLDDLYDKIIFIDSDIIITSDIVKPIFSLSDGYEFAAALDLEVGERPYGGQNYFNSGLMVIKPSKKTYENMIQFFGNGSFHFLNQFEWDEGLVDQDFLNFYFGASWKRLPSIYNTIHVLLRTEEEIESAVVIHAKFWKEESFNALPKHVQMDYEHELGIAQKILQ